MLPLLLSLATASEPISTEPPRYPVRAVYDSSVEVRCRAAAVVDARGRADEVEIKGCAPYDDEAFHRRADRALSSWRWPKDAPTQVDVEVVFEPPVDTLVPVQPLSWRRRWHGACQVRIAVDADGTPRVRGADDGCVPVLAAVEPTPPAVVARRAPEVCVVTFQAEDGVARHVETFRCDLRLRRYVKDAVSAWSWAGEGVRAHTLVLQLDGDR